MIAPLSPVALEHAVNSRLSLSSSYIAKFPCGGFVSGQIKAFCPNNDFDG
jgi:hypothetical protein